MAKYTYKTYNIAGFHLPEGMYSIAELEQMLADFKEAKQRQDECLKAAIQPVKEKKHVDNRELMHKILSFLETNYLVMCSQFHMQRDALADDLRKQLAQPDEWKGLSSFDKTLLRTTHAPLKPLYHDRVNDRSVCAEVVTDWDKFFKAIESKLQERNT